MAPKKKQGMSYNHALAEMQGATDLMNTQIAAGMPRADVIQEQYDTWVNRINTMQGPLNDKQRMHLIEASNNGP